MEELDGWIALNLHVDALVAGVDGRDVSDSLEGLSGFLILGSQVLAVSTPWGVELNQP